MKGQTDIQLEKLSNEELLVKAFESQDQRFFNEFYSRFNHVIFLNACKFLDSSRTHDIVSEVLTAITSHKNPDQIKSVTNYLFRTTKNKCLNLLEKEAKRRSSIEQFKIENNSSNFMEFNNLEPLYSREHKYQKLEEAIKTLSEDQQLCINLFYLENQSYKQIVNNTSLSSKAVKSAIQNGKRRLLKLLSSKNEY